MAQVKHPLNAVLANVSGEYRVINESAYVDIASAKPVDNCDADSIAWVAGDKKNKKELIQSSRAQTLVCSLSDEELAGFETGKCLILVNDPRLTFLRIVKGLFTAGIQYGVHPSAVVHPEAEIHPESYIGPHVYIGKSKIGKNTIVHGSCFIYDSVEIGNNVTIHAGTVIGADGFGYQRNERNEFEKFPHVGGVVIEDNVEIGANTCIDRGSLGNTLIAEGAKIDNLVHIAHNVKVGRHAAVIAHAMVGGSTIIGDYAWISPSVALRDRISVGKNSVAGLGSVVTKEIPNDQTWAGSPARELSEFLLIQKKLKVSD